MSEIPQLDRYQLLKGRDTDGNRFFAVLDGAIEMIIAEGSRDEMAAFMAARKEQDKMSLWK